MADQITTKPMQSRSQWRYLFASGKPFARRWAEATPGGKGARFRRLPIKKKEYTVAEFAKIALKGASDPAATTLAAMHTPELLTLKGEQLAPGVTRIHGDLCNVHGRWGSCAAAGYGGAATPSKRVAPKKLPTAPKPKAGGRAKKGATARKPVKTDAQREQERQAKRAQALQQRQAGHEQNAAKVLRDLAIPEDAAGALADLRAGRPIDDDGGLIKMGLAEQGTDGVYRLTATGRAFVSAAEAGDAGRARDALGRARDQRAARDERATASAERKRATEERQAALAAKRTEAARLRAERLAKQKKGGGGGKGKKPAAAPNPTVAPRTTSSRPRPVLGGGGGKGPRQPQAKKPVPQLPQALTDAAQALSEGQEIDEQTAALLIRNGLAKRNKDGVLILTAAGQRATKKDYQGSGIGSASTQSRSALHPGGMETASSNSIPVTRKSREQPGQAHPVPPDLIRNTTPQTGQGPRQGVQAASVASSCSNIGIPPAPILPSPFAVFKEAASDYLVVEDVAKPSTYHLQVKRNGKVDHGLLGSAWAALHGGFRGNKYEGPNKGEALTKLKRLYAQEGMPLPSEKSFAVFKDASGRYRWITRTTTAYRDRDGEIISEKALEDDAVRMTVTGTYGPLRYWHVGKPDPLNTEAPWGPGLDIGTCDFSTVIGRTSIESGTFKTEAIGRAFSEDASSYELSPGFFHAPTEPDARTGVFNHIRRFERSVVPTQHGRASNLFTGLTVKEHQMDQETYDRRVKAYLDFAREKGIPPEDAAAPIVAMEQADKEAAAKQIAYKEEGGKKPAIIDLFRAFFTDEQPQTTTKEEEAPVVEPTTAPAPPPTGEVAGQWVGADALAVLKTQIDTLTSELASLKPPPMLDTEDDPAQGGDAGVDEAAEGEPPMDESGGLTLSSDDLAAIGQMVGGVLQAALEPLVGALGITQKLDGHMTELKTLMGGYVKQKSADDTQRADTIAALKATIDQQQAAITESQAKLGELLGDQPRGGYRPSQATDNGADQLLAAIKNGPDGPSSGGPFDDLIANLFPGLAQGGTA